jgi:glycosyltransferase involved in cell wall biosynthesis
MSLKITYLVANYNNGRYIKDCVASLHAQSSPAWHCLIADDKSTDDSLAIIQPLLNDKIELLTNEENLGKSRTLARLLDHAPTDIVGILDPDDALYPLATELVLQAYLEHPEAGFVYTNLTFYDQALKRALGAGRSTPIQPGGNTLWGGYVGAMRTFRLKAYRQTTGFEANILYAEDRDLVYKMEEVTPFVFVDQALYKYRKVPNSHTNAPEKRRIGIQNHRMAYQNALQRRNIHGLKKVIYLLYFQERYSGHRISPVALIPAGRLIKRFLMRLFG